MLDNELQLGINSDLYGQLSVKRRLQSATPKRDNNKEKIFNNFTIIQSVVSLKSFHTSVISCWLFYNFFVWEKMCFAIIWGNFYWEKYSVTLKFSVVSQNSPFPNPT